MRAAWSLQGCVCSAIQRECVCFAFGCLCERFDNVGREARFYTLDTSNGPRNFALLFAKTSSSLKHKFATTQQRRSLTLRTGFHFIQTIFNNFCSLPPAASKNIFFLAPVCIYENNIYMLMIYH